MTGAFDKMLQRANAQDSVKTVAEPIATPTPVAAVVPTTAKKRGRPASKKLAPVGERVDYLRADCTSEDKLRYKTWAVSHGMSISELVLEAVEFYIQHKG